MIKNILMSARAPVMTESSLIEHNTERLLDCLPVHGWECASQQVCDDRVKLVLEKGSSVRFVDVFPRRLRLSLQGTTIFLPMPDHNAPAQLVREMERIA
jgi:hypothetical protein